ncbi:MAG: DUF547 domain-containing protein [Sedimentisphaerales bacterium]|nr:DUF547 domain-containing protein [Sedimentisphaerales bacterium]
MIKRLDVVTVLLVVLIFVAGCSRSTAEAEETPPFEHPKAPVNLSVTTDIWPDQTIAVESEPDEPAEPQQDVNDVPSAGEEASPRQNEPNNTEFVASEPNDTTVNTTEPNQTEPGDVEPNIPDANDIETTVAKPNIPDANDIGTPIVEPNTPDINDVSITATEPNDPNVEPIASFHDKCAEILKTFVDEKGMVNYRMLRRKRPDLNAVLDEFNTLDPNVYESWSEEDKIAFWINAYNLKMLNIITEKYPIEPLSRFHAVLWGPDSIRHIDGIWTRFKFLVMDEVFTLSEIEKRFFRKKFDDPRIFLALTRASLSGPPLSNEPYYGYKLNEQLDKQARKYLANPLAFKVDKEKGKVYLSAIFQKTQYGKEFVSKYGIDRKFKAKEPETRAVLNFITNYVSEEVKSFLEIGNYTIQFMGYNWTINDGS